MVKRVAAIHDLAGLGRCSLTAIIPVLSVMGIQCCPVPTAVLSSHTGGYDDFSFLDMTPYLPDYTRQWKHNHERFDAIYSGFLGSCEQVELVLEFVGEISDRSCLILVDPVMGDDGKAYKTCTPDLCAGMSRLVKMADVVTPNPTEAAILLGESFDAIPTTEEGYCDWAVRLSEMGPPIVVITGIPCGTQTVGVASFDRRSLETRFSYGKKVSGHFPGTGDIFASVLLGKLLGGEGLSSAVRFGMDFVKSAVESTVEQHTPVREGLSFEPLLRTLL